MDLTKPDACKYTTPVGHSCHGCGCAFPVTVAVWHCASRRKIDNTGTTV